MSILPDELLVDIAKSQLEEQWQWLKILQAEGEIDKKDMNRIQYGIGLEFNINAVIHGRNHTKPKCKLMIIENQEYDLDEFEEEMDRRHTLAIQLILGCLDNTDSIRGPNDEK
jgi:hypothetical protein